MWLSYGFLEVRDLKAVSENTCMKKKVSSACRAVCFHLVLKLYMGLFIISFQLLQATYPSHVANKMYCVRNLYKFKRNNSGLAPLIKKFIG